MRPKHNCALPLKYKAKPVGHRFIRTTHASLLEKNIKHTLTHTNVSAKLYYKMPVRSSVCTYSPASSGLSNSKYSTVLPTPSSLSIGQYKPLSSWSSYAGTSSGVGTGSKYSAGSSHLSSSSISSGLGSDRAPSRYSLSTSSYSPSSSSSLNSSSYSSLNSTSSSASSNYAPTLSGIHHTSSGSGYYRPLSSAHNSFTGSATSRYGSGHNSLTADSPSRFSSGTSSSSSSISSATSSLLDRTESFLNSNGSNYVRNYQPPSPSLSSSRRVSYTVSKKLLFLPIIVYDSDLRETSQTMRRYSVA